MNLNDYTKGWPAEAKAYLETIMNAGPTSAPIDAQESVKDKDLNAPPGAPTAGDRYIIAAVATGAWVGKEKYITHWNGSAWLFTAPNEGMLLWVEDENLVYTYNDASWVVNPLTAHALVGALHTTAGVAAGQVIKGTAPNTAAWGTLNHSELGGVGATDHHTNANDPSADQKAALAGTNGAPADGNRYVTNSDGRLPTTDEKAALAGTNGAPGAGNPYVTTTDPRVAGIIAAGNPILDMLNVAGGAAVAAAGGDIILVGRNLLQGQTFDSLHLTEALGGDLTVTCLKPGDSGFTIEMIKGAGAASVAFVGGKLTIDIGAAGSSDDAIATLINANAAATDGIFRAVSAAAGNFTVAQAEAPMTGGAGNYAGNKVYVGGLEALPANQPGTSATAKWSATGITCTTQAVGAATDVVNIQVESNALLSAPLSAVLV